MRSLKATKRHDHAHELRDDEIIERIEQHFGINDKKDEEAKEEEDEDEIGNSLLNQEGDAIE